MKTMNNLHFFLDLKLTIAAVLFSVITFSGIELSIKIIGGILFIGYNARRWWLMEKNHKKD